MTHGRVSIFVLGVQKCGTTSIADILNSHPDIFVPSIKETYYFCLDSRFSKGEAWFHSEFYNSATAARAQHWAEATPFNLVSKEAVDRIASYADDTAKFIVILREPVKRAFSAFQHQVRLGNETLSFEQALEQEDSRIESERTRTGRWWRYAYTRVGQYGAQIEYAKQRLGKDRLLVLRQDELKDVAAVNEKMQNFLELNAPFPAKGDTRANPASMPRSKLIRNLVTKDNPLKKIAKKLLPREIRSKIGTALNRANAKVAPREALEPSVESELATFFEADQRVLAGMKLASHDAAKNT